MSKRVSIIITGVGSGVAQSIIKALKYANMQNNRNYFLIGTDANWRAAGLHVLDKAYLIPYCSKAEYIPQLIEICNYENVDFLIPGTDPELQVLSNNKDLIEQKSKVHIIINPSKTIEIGYDKFKTSEFLKENGFPYPKTVCLDRNDIELRDLNYPFIIKPRYGSGSIGLALIKNKGMLENHLATYNEEMVAQEFIDVINEEYTCGLSFNKNGQLVSSIILKRILKKGFTQFAQVTEQEKVDRQINEISRILEGRGGYNIQGRLAENGFVVFEINPRFSGTTAFRAVAGQNEPDIYIQHYLNQTLPASTSIKPMCMIRYLNECYIDPNQESIFKSNTHQSGPKGFTVNYF